MSQSVLWVPPSNLPPALCHFCVNTPSQATSASTDDYLLRYMLPQATAMCSYTNDVCACVCMCARAATITMVVLMTVFNVAMVVVVAVAAIGHWWV